MLDFSCANSIYSLSITQYIHDTSGGLIENIRFYGPKKFGQNLKGELPIERRFELPDGQLIITMGESDHIIIMDL